MYIPWSVSVALAYVCGSIPFGLLIGLARGVDLRKVGSGNIGATNAGRVLGRKVGIACFVLDLLKGMLPVLFAGMWFGLVGEKMSLIKVTEIWWWLAVAVAAVIGHVAPVWLGFKGGKGVATSLGVLLGFWPFLALPALGAGLTWVIVVKMSKYVSLASIAAAVGLPVYVAIIAVVEEWGVQRTGPLLMTTTAIGLLVVLRHRANIGRLWNGTESKIGAKKGSAEGSGIVDQGSGQDETNSSM